MFQENQSVHFFMPLIEMFLMIYRKVVDPPETVDVNINIYIHIISISNYAVLFFLLLALPKQLGKRITFCTYQSQTSVSQMLVFCTFSLRKYNFTNNFCIVILHNYVVRISIFMNNCEMFVCVLYMNSVTNICLLWPSSSWS